MREGFAADFLQDEAKYEAGGLSAPRVAADVTTVTVEWRERGTESEQEEELRAGRGGDEEGEEGGGEGGRDAV